MVDLRDRVKEDRGLLKKLELAIPGFRGYRKREDLRIADSLLRKQLADGLGKIVERIELCRKDLAKDMEMELLNDIAALVNHATATENRVRHAEQGYSPISPDYKVREDQLDDLYEWDLNLLDDIQEISGAVSALEVAINRGDLNHIEQGIGHAERELREFNDLFNTRIETIAGLGATGR
jgi:hypothetical protein